MRLDPPSFPIRFAAHDARADGHSRDVEIGRDRVLVRRSLRGIRMAIAVRVEDFLGVEIVQRQDGSTLMLRHRDPSLCVPLAVAPPDTDLSEAWQMWSETFALPQLANDNGEPAPRRRRRNAIRARRPRILMRRRVSRLVREMNVYRGEREIIART